MKTEFQYIRFVETGRRGKTRWFFCENRSSNNDIGEVKWYNPWRQYCFYPYDVTIFSSGCLKDIVQFIEELKLEEGR